MSRRDPKKKKCCNEDYDKIKKQIVKQQKVCEQKVKKTEIETINTEELFINNKLFPTSIIPYKISSSTTIVGDNVPLEACNGCPKVAPIATPGTPSGGLFTLGQSFSGKITFWGVKSLTLELSSLNISNDNDYAIEIINCDKVYIKGGNVASKNATAILIQCSSDVEISWISVTNTKNVVEIVDSFNVRLKELNMTRISGVAIDVDCTNYLRLQNLDINKVEELTDNALVRIQNSEMIFINKAVFYNINVEDHSNLVDFSSIIYLNKCFDIKVSAISILTTYVKALVNKDVNLYLFYMKECGSAILNNFIIDGDHLEVSGVSAGKLNCVRIENSNNTFVARQLLTDNSVYGDDNSTNLDMTTFHMEDVDTFTLSGFKSLTNFVLGGNVNTAVKVGSFHGLRGGNWFLSGNISAQNYNEHKDELYLPLSSVIGFEIVDVSSTVFIRSTSSNNHGELSFPGVEPKYNAGEVAGFKIYGIDATNNSFTNIVLDNIQANRNISNTDSATSTTIGIMSTYSNTKVHSSYAVANEAGGKCYGILFPGLVDSKQKQAAVYTTSSNDNLSYKSDSYGVYAGSVDLGQGETQGVETLVVLKSSFNKNGGFGIYSTKVKITNIDSNTLNENGCGLCINEGSNNIIFGNKASSNDVGYKLEKSNNSFIRNNTSQDNGKGFVDNSQYNVYYKNESLGDVKSFEDVTPSRLSWYEFNPTTGSFTPKGPAIVTPLGSFSNTSTPKF